MSLTLDVVCTDRGTHPRRQLARFVWEPEAVLRSAGFAVWDETTPAPELAPRAEWETARGTTRGTTRHVVRTPVEVRERTDGGRTFILPRCPTCGAHRPRVALRDDALAVYVDATHDTPARILDVSLRLR